MLPPLTDLIGECGHTKTTKRHGTKKKSWYWTTEYQVAFEKVKETLARQVMLAYPTYGELFEIYTDASSLQLGAVITQRGGPLFSKTRSKIELLMRVSTYPWIWKTIKYPTLEAISQEPQDYYVVVSSWGGSG